MDINYIDYEALELARKEYNDRGNELRDIADRVLKMNGQLEQGWKNDTARGFMAAINQNNVPQLIAASDALHHIAKYIGDYVRDQKEKDAEGRKGFGY